MRTIKTSLLLAVLLVSFCLPLYAQAPLDDSRVMLQGFYWESHRFGHPDKFPQMGTKHWYEIVRADAADIQKGRFDLLWLPPPCYAGTISAGYNPKQYFNLNNSYGSFNQQRALLTTLRKDGIEPIADIVINHRDGNGTWTDFQNPDWGLWSICGDDEAFSNPQSPVYNTPLPLRGAPEEKPTPYSAGTYAYPDFRDIDHTNKQVRRDILRYLLELKSAGYRGWRYDMVQGYHAKWVALYNKRTQPTFSVGEYQWDREGEQRGWLWWTATTPSNLATSSAVFDFSTMFTLKDNKGKYSAWYGFGSGLGLTGDTTDGVAWKQRSVTFLENHDTGYRTEEDGTPQKGHEFDSFANNWEVEQGYAYVLTHPGVPCVYWKHYFDWGTDLHDKIKALINARKVAGVHAGSALHPQNNARLKGVYAAMVEGKKGQLYVRIGGSDNDWQPSDSGYKDYRAYGHGNGWSVWVTLPGNPILQQAPLPVAISAPPVYQPGDQINVPDSDLE